MTDTPMNPTPLPPRKQNWTEKPPTAGFWMVVFGIVAVGVFIFFVNQGLAGLAEKTKSNEDLQRQTCLRYDGQERADCFTKAGL